MPIPPRVSVVALRTADLARSTAFYVGLGWELSAASTAAMSLFKTAGSLLLVCTDDLLDELGGQEVAAALAGEPTGEARAVHPCGHRWRGRRRSRGSGPSRRGRGQAGRSHPFGRVIRVLRRPRWTCVGSYPPPPLPTRDRRAARDPVGCGSTRTLKWHTMHESGHSSEGRGDTKHKTRLRPALL
jgi:catechol 2,3-dioxygenase-like lactoylglutathione lyase family enzyme